MEKGGMVLMDLGERSFQEESKRRVLIVDDSPQVRQELRTLLPLAGDIEIVGEAADGLEAIRLAKALRPEVILMDLEMPVLDGYEATRQIKVGFPSCRVVALTVYGDPESRIRAAEVGVDVFLVKGVSVESLVQVISERTE
ncbi:MAG TPA: response regulator transcription factor [Anaerolineae bacterium]|nr:response regulator transcription factor [Anaerolineae bacterium]